MKLLIAWIASIFLIGSAMAADLPLKAPAVSSPAVDPWSGPYVGLNLGGARGRSSATGVIECGPGGYLCDENIWKDNGALVGVTASGTRSDTVFTGGVLAGYNWRRANVLFGLEGDISTLHLRLTNGGTAPSINLGLLPSVFTASTTAATDWLATIRARLGFIVSPDLLVYVTGGLALTDLSVSNSYSDNFGVGAAEYSKTSSILAGYAVGGGAEWNLSRSWALKAEYLYVAFPSITTFGGVAINGVIVNNFTGTADLRVHIARVGAILRF